MPGKRSRPVFIDVEAVEGLDRRGNRKLQSQPLPNSPPKKKLSPQSALPLPASKRLRTGETPAQSEIDGEDVPLSEKDSSQRNAKVSYTSQVRFPCMIMTEYIDRE